MKSSPVSVLRTVSRDTSPDGPIAQPPRLREACESCHSSKVKCSGGTPCARCSQSRSECIYKFVKRIGKPKGARNKSTLRRLEMERAAREEAGRAITPAPPSDNHYENIARLPGTTHNTARGHRTGNTASSSVERPSQMQPWSYFSDSRNWPSDEDAPGGAFQLLSDPMSSPGNWVYGSALGTIECNPALMSRAPIEEHFLRGSVDYLDELNSSINTPGHISSRLPSLTSESSYSSSPFGGPAPAPVHPSDAANAFTNHELYTTPPTDEFPAHTSCHCAENLASQLCGFRHPEALNFATRSADGFILNTDRLLTASNTFLDCQICEKNSMALSLLTTIFATFGQLFGGLAATSSRHSSPSAASPSINVISHDLHRQLSLGSYQSSSDDENNKTNNAMTLVMTQTAQKWRTASFKALQVLERLQARSHGYALDGSQFDLDPSTGEEGTPLWGSADIESFARIVSRVDNELASFA